MKVTEKLGALIWFIQEIITQVYLKMSIQYTEFKLVYHQRDFLIN